MSSTVFKLQSNKFSTDSIRTSLACPKCQEIFSKEFPLDLEGQTIEFKCPVCLSGGESDLPYKNPEEKENLDWILMWLKRKLVEKNMRDTTHSVNH
jgi:hypothetical protein